MTAGDRLAVFLVVPTGAVRVSLRRFTFGSTLDGPAARLCPTDNYGHDASAVIGEAPPARHGDGALAAIDPAVYRGDGRWPMACDGCGEPFADGDEWQVGQEPLYVAPDGGVYTVREMPPGALWDSWYSWKGPDGRSLCLTLPPEGGYDFWPIDGPASGGGGWTRSGELPLITVRPSILTPRFHGVLTDGVLVDVGPGSED